MREAQLERGIIFGDRHTDEYVYMPGSEVFGRTIGYFLHNKTTGRTIAYIFENCYLVYKAVFPLYNKRKV